MNRHQVLTGAANSGDQCFASGNVEGINFTAYAAGCDIVILASDFQRVQIIAGVLHDNLQVTCIDCCTDVGKIAVAYGSRVCIFEPTPLLHHDSTHKLDYKWYHTGTIETGCDIFTLSWNLEGSRLLTGGQLVQMWHCPEIDSSVEFFLHDDRMTSSAEDGFPQWVQLWHCKPATPVQQVTFSPDGLLFGTVGKNDRLLKIWYENRKVQLPMTRSDSISPKKEDLNYSFVYIAHPRAVRGFSWRKTSKYMPRGSVANMLITSCKDNISRLWCETILPEDGLVDVLQLNPDATQNPMFNTRRHKRRFMQRLHHFRHVVHQRKGNAHQLPITPMPSSKSVHDFHKFGIHPTNTAPGFHFHLAGCINPDTDIPMVPAMSRCSDSKELRFVAHWLNNKELHFSHGAEKILEEMSRKSSAMENQESDTTATNVHSDSDEFSSDNAADTGKVGESVSGKKEGKLKRSAQSESMDSERSAMSTSSSSFGMPESKTADNLDRQIEGLLRDWHHNPDMLFSIHPVDGSFLVWVVDWLDEYNPGSFRQAQINMSSRIPQSFPLGDAKTMSSHMLLYSNYGRLNIKSAMKQSEDTTKTNKTRMDNNTPASSEFIQTPNVNLVSKHNNGSLNLWQINFSESSQFSTVQCVVHVSRACGHRFQTNHVACHPVLPLLLTTSHHNVPHADTQLPRPRYPGGKRDPGPGGFCSELILWNVEAVGPLSKSGGVTELARINSPEMSAFSNVAWLPTLLPGSGTLSRSPSALFVASDGDTLRVYQAVIDARKLLSGVQLKAPPTEVSQSDSAGSLVSDGDVELPVKTTIAADVSIVSLQSTACPGAILQLDRILDAEHDWQHIQMIHVFQDQLITGQESLQCGFKINAQMEPIVDLQNMKTFEEHFYLVVIEKLINGTSVLHMWRIIISSHGDDNHVGCYSPDVNFFQEDESGEQFHPVTSEPATSQQNNSGRRLAITTSKVRTQTLALPEGVQVVCATMAAGHLSSSSIYPACFAPYLISTASTDGCTRFWKCHTTSEIGDIPGTVTRHFEWMEWDMMIQKDDVSEIYVPGRPITVSCAYSGRIAIAYRMGHVRVHGPNPDSKFINLYVAIYECESTGGSEWTLEDTIELKNICIANVKTDLDLAAIFGGDHHDENIVSSTKTTPAVTRTSVPSAMTIKCVKRSLSTQQPDSTQVLTQEHLVQLDWVTTEDGSHILTVGVGPNIMLYAAVSSEIASASVKEMPAPTRGILQKSKSMTVQQVVEEIRWMKIRTVELSTADGLPPLPMHISWVRDGLLVVGMDNEMHVYSQWQAPKIVLDAVSTEKIDTADVRTLTQQKMHRVTSMTNVNPVRSSKIARSMSNMALTAGLVSVASISNLNMLMEMKEEKVKKRELVHRHKPDTHKVETDSDTAMHLMQDSGLFEAARLANPVLPQYHPKQLIELLNFGRIQRVKAILAHLLRCISGTAETSMSYDSHKGRQRLFSAPTLTAPPGSPDMLQDEVQLDYSEISSIPPLPLYALIAADDDTTTYTPMERGQGTKLSKKDEDHYEALFEIGGSDDELDDAFACDDDNMSSRSTRGSDDECQPVHPNYFGPQHAQMLAGHLTYTHLPGLSRLDQMYLLAVADTVANAKLDVTKKHTTENVDAGREGEQGETTDIVDDCGLRFLLAARHYIYMQNTMPMRQRAQLLQQGLSPANVVWAFHSEAEQDLLNVIPSYQRGAPVWYEMKQFGVGWWIKNITTLRRLIEKLAKVAFQAKKDPLDAALFYLAMKKKNVLWGLFRSVNEDKMQQFFKNDFTQERWRKAALKNAFSLLGKQRFEHAAAFFLLGGAVDDAIEVCINKLDDIQLAIVVARLYGNDINEMVPAKLKCLLYEKCLGCNASGQNPDITNAHPDPFIRSMSCWLLKDYSAALGTLLETKAGSARVDDESDKDAYLAKPSVFNFYNYLRTHPLLFRQNLAASASGKAVLLAGFSQKQLGGNDIVTFVDKISPVERSLYFMTAHAHFKSGCPALALEVLSKLPAVVDTSNDITTSHSGDVSATSVISSGTIDEFSGKTGDNADSFDWSQSTPKTAQTTDDFDWSQPVSAPVEDELVLTFDDDDDDDKDDTDEEPDSDDTEQKVTDVSEDDNKTLTESDQVSDCRKKTEVGDIMAHQLKFIACLKIMMEELATLATGFEVDGGQLRYQLYVWLEKEVDVLKKLCNYGQDIDATNLPGMHDGSSSESREDDSALFSHSHTLHEVILAEKMDFEAKLRRMAKRKQWLKTNQQLLRTLLSYSVLHGSCGGGLASVRMELILLLQELQQEKTTQQLLSPLPFPTTLPLLSSSISRAVIVNPIRHLENMTHDMLYTIVNFREPPTLTYLLPKVMTLRNMSAALSACIYQCLCDSDDFVISRNEHYDVGMEGFTSTKVVYTDSYLMAGAHGRRRLSSASSGGDDVPNSTPGMWPGVSSLQALLARDRDENQPELNMLLTEATVAVYTSLLIHSLTTYDPNLLYRLVANPFVERMWPALFGGGVKKLIRLNRAADAPTKVAQSNDDVAKQRLKLHMKLLEAGGSSVPMQENRMTFKEKFVPPEVSMLSYFMAKPFVMPELLGVEYDSAESVYSSDEEDEEELIGASSSEKKKQEHLDPNSYSWCLMRYAIVKFIHYRLTKFLPQIGIELSDLPVRSPLLQAVLTALDRWKLILKDRLQMFAGLPEDYIPGLFVDNITTGPAMLKYKALLEANNTPFLSTHYSALPAKRLWHYLVQQQPIQEVFIRYIFKKRQPQNDSYKKDTHTSSPDDPIKIVHKEQDVIAAFCLNQANTNCMALSTHKELMELDVSGIITPPMWLQDETEYDIETIKRPSNRTADTTDFLVVQTAADKHVLSNGFANSPGGSMPSVYSSGRLHDHDREGSMIKGLSKHAVVNPDLCPLYIVDRSRRMLRVMMKRQVAGVRRMGPHPSLPYYLTGSQDGSVRLWEWSQQHCIAVARQPGSFPKVAKVAFSAQGNKFGVGDSEGSVCLWQVGLGRNMTKPFLRLQCHNKNLTDFVFMGSSSVLATAGHSLENRNVCIWDTLLPHRSALVQAFSCHHDGSAAVVYAPQHQALISAGKRGDICIFDVRQRQLRHTFQAHDAAIRSMTLQPSEGIFATAAVDGDIKVWGLAVHNLMFSFVGKHSKGSIFRNNGSGPIQLYLGGQGHLFSCGADGSMKIRHLPDKLLMQQSVY